MVIKSGKMAKKIGNSKEFPNSQNQNSVKVTKKSKKKAKVIVYSTPTCPYCRLAKDFLKKRNTAFKAYDVSTDDKARAEMIKKSGQMGVPVLDIKGAIIVGYDEDAIKAALK